ncbi:MAG: hypothetical protein Q9207_005155 [Kuettlingeria erythrocarpa]
MPKTPKLQGESMFSGSTLKINRSVSNKKRGETSWKPRFASLEAFFAKADVEVSKDGATADFTNLGGFLLSEAGVKVSKDTDTRGTGSEIMLIFLGLSIFSYVQLLFFASLWSLADWLSDHLFGRRAPTPQATTISPFLNPRNPVPSPFARDAERSRSPSLTAKTAEPEDESDAEGHRRDPGLTTEQRTWTIGLRTDTCKR